MEVKYLNTDLEIESKSDLSKIVEHFGDDVLVHLMAKSGDINMQRYYLLAATYETFWGFGVSQSFTPLVDREAWNRPAPGDRSRWRPSRKIRG